MSWNGELVIDLDSHIVERADRFYEAYIDPAFRDVDSQQVRFVTGENTVSPRSSVRGGEADGKGTGAHTAVERERRAFVFRILKGDRLKVRWNWSRY